MNQKLDYQLLEKILRQTQPELKQMLNSRLKEQGYQTTVECGYLSAPGDVPVLLVAHLDTVHRQPVQIICYSENRRIAMSPQGIGGDDRAGVFMILQIIKKARCHVLFCEDEEIGGKGAEQFAKSGIKPQVNYLVELDRRGRNDAVFYGCANQEFIQFVEGFGFQEEFGTFSDISIIAPQLETAAVNISAGYYYEHSPREYIDLVHMMNNVQRVIKMAQTDCGHFRYVWGRSFGFGGWQERLPLWDFTPEEKVQDLMEVPTEAYVKVNGQVVENGLLHYMDKSGNVYDYLDEVGAAVLAEHTKAYTLDDQPLEFSEHLAEPVEVMTLEEAFRFLNAI